MFIKVDTFKLEIGTITEQKLLVTVGPTLPEIDWWKLGRNREEAMEGDGGRREGGSRGGEVVGVECSPRAKTRWGW